MRYYYVAFVWISCTCSLLRIKNVTTEDTSVLGDYFPYDSNWMVTSQQEWVWKVSFSMYRKARKT